MSVQRYNYACIISECKEKTFVIPMEEDEQDAEIICPTCEQPMKLLGEIRYGGIGRFNMLSPNEKQKVLSKRSKEHFKRTKLDEFHQKNHPDFKP